jgi:hypothetical protein
VKEPIFFIFDKDPLNLLLSDKNMFNQVNELNWQASMTTAPDEKFLYVLNPGMGIELKYRYPIIVHYNQGNIFDLKNELLKLHPNYNIRVVELVSGSGNFVYIPYRST